MSPALPPLPLLQSPASRRAQRSLNSSRSRFPEGDLQRTMADGFEEQLSFIELKQLVARSGLGGPRIKWAANKFEVIRVIEEQKIDLFALMAAEEAERERERPPPPPPNEDEEEAPPPPPPPPDEEEEEEAEEEEEEKEEEGNSDGAERGPQPSVLQARRVTQLSHRSAALTSVVLSSGEQLTTLEALLETVSSGAIGALRGSWLAELHARGEVLGRRQDLPDEAFWSPAQLRRVATGLREDYGLLFVALSAQCLSPAHPDPHGFHLASVAELASLYLGEMRYERPTSPLQAAFARHNLSGDHPVDFALYWSYGSLMQPPHSLEEERIYRAGVDASRIWFGHRASVHWMLTTLPEDHDDEDEANPPIGWSVAEELMSAMLKPDMRQRIMYSGGQPADDGDNGGSGGGGGGGSLLPSAAEGVSVYGGDGWRAQQCVDHVYRASRPPPVLPAELREQVLPDLVADRHRQHIDEVAEGFEGFFQVCCEGIATLECASSDWGDEEVAKLCTILPLFRRPVVVNLQRNTIGHDGVAALILLLSSGRCTISGLNVMTMPTHAPDRPHMHSLGGRAEAKRACT